MLYFSLTSPHTPLAVTDNWENKSGLSNSYADFVMQTDAVVGQILDELKGNGAEENTIVFFLSDNGCGPYIGAKDLEAKGHFVSGPLRGYKGDVWEGGHRTPFIVRFSQCIRLGSWKLICTNEPELYNLAKDVGETKNIASENPDVVEKMTALRKKLVKDGRSTPGAVQQNDVEVITSFGR